MDDKINIGQLLLKDKIITQEQLEHAKAVQDKAGGLIEMILVKQGFITPQNLTKYMKILEEKKREAGIKSEKPKKLRLGEILIQANEITREQLDEALEKQKGTSERLGIVLVDLGYVSRQTLVKYLTKQSQMVIDSMGLLNYEATDIVGEAEQ